MSRNIWAAARIMERQQQKLDDEEDAVVGYRCQCGITVLVDPARTDKPQIPLRLCNSCYSRRGSEK